MSAAERVIAPIGFLVVAGPNQAFAITPAQLQAALLQSQLGEQRQHHSQHHTSAVPATAHAGSQIEPRNSWILVNAKNSSNSVSGKQSNVTLLEFQPPGTRAAASNPFLRAGAIESGHQQQQQQLVMSLARESPSVSSSSLREHQGQLLTMQEAFLQAHVHAG
jgi:hypothetical protein